MNPTQPVADDLRRHLEEGGDAQASCPSADAWWKGWTSELPKAEFDALVDHAAACAACSLASRTAREMVRRLEPARYRGVNPRPARWVARAGFAAAAAVLLAVIGLTIVPWRGRVHEAETRGAADDAPRSLVGEGRPIPRAACVLRWSAGPEGTVYNVEVTDDGMRPLASGRSLRLPEFQVPVSALAGLPPGARLVWQVTAIAPDGRRTASHTLFNTID